MKNRKLNLDELQVESFVTSFDAYQDGTVRGGAIIQKEAQTTIQPEDTPIWKSGGLSTPQLTPARETFADADTRGCPIGGLTKTSPTLPKL